MVTHRIVSLFASLLAFAATLAHAQTDMGALTVKSRDGSRVEAPLLATDIDVTVSGPVARTRVTQQFINPTDKWVEATYTFPLSDGAAVDTLKMVAGNRVIIGEIKERAAARQIYEQARTEGRRASLVEQQRPNVFTTDVANVGPGDTVVVQIELQEAVRISDGEYALRVPLVVAPRYTPAPLRQEFSAADVQQGWSTGEQWTATPVLDPRLDPPANPVALRVHLNAGFPLAEVKSHHHAIAVQTIDDTARDITFTPNDVNGVVAADRDFELTWRARSGATPTVGLFRERVGDADYLLAMIVPPSGAAPGPRLPRETILVVDTSGSMGGESIEQARASLLIALDGLKAGDRFNIIRFSDDMSQLFAQPVAVDAQSIATAQRFVNGLQAYGGTEMIPALRAALRDPDANQSGIVRQIVFLTDGAISNEQQMFELIGNARGRSRIFMVGIGSAPNSHLMTRAAELGRGTFTHIGSTAQVQQRMSELFAKLESPVVTGLAAKIEGLAVEFSPNPLPDLYRGEPVLLFAKAPQLHGSLSIQGSSGAQPWSAVLPLDQVREGQGIAKLWARRRIDGIEASAILGNIAPDESDRQILALALEHHLVSRLSSLVAVDHTPVRPANQRLTRADIPLNLPAGWDFDKVFGNRGMRDAISNDDGDDPVLLAAASNSVLLPRTGTLSQLTKLLGLMLGMSGFALIHITQRQQARS
ncbi:MAG: marine proteobacterial sortase target protein [Nevskiaceae bacterium]|jgi:Ca-activated chloride channel family protein|nr:marine proteobacterial sortase target protein [Nevskiaceae bacterium]